MTEIVWEEPPPRKVSRTHTGYHNAIAAELKRNPGRWAKIMDGSSQIAVFITAARYQAYGPAGSFEAVARNSRSVDGRKSEVYDIYVRYIGDEA